MNPLLAQNMGRWAEVYFTALPENRDQAVLDLLCELRDEAPQQEHASTPEAAPSPADSAVSVSDDTSLSAPFVRCPQCGYENRSDHNFCGSCRAELKNPASAMAFFDALIPNTDPGEAQRADAPQMEAQSLTSEAGEQPSIDQLELERLRFEQRKWKLDQPILDQPIPVRSRDGQSVDRRGSVRPKMDRSGGTRQNDVNLFRFSSVAERPRSYRIYIAVALAILILLFLYRARWGGHAAGTSQTARQLRPAITAETSGPATASATPNSAALRADTSRPSPPPGAMSRPNAEPASNSVPNRKTDVRPETVSHQAVPPASTATPASAADTEGLSLWGSGAAELTLAKSYLNGTDGKERNGVEAAALLWKAVAKQNAEATELLSDLYLKGDGVPKSCDQARILLDAAARKGRKDAGERLSHLEAFGCQ